MELWLELMKLGAKLGCHQKPERSFFIKGYQFPVCARCTGLIAGYVLGLIMSIRISSISWAWIGLCIPMAIDGGTQYLGLRLSTQLLRFSTGMACGIGVMLAQVKIIRMIIQGVLT